MRFIYDLWDLPIYGPLVIKIFYIDRAQVMVEMVSHIPNHCAPVADTI